MSFATQIENLKIKKDNLNNNLMDMDLSISKIRSDIGRLKRTHKALLDDDIDVGMDINEQRDLKLSMLINWIINNKESVVDDMEKDMSNIKTDIKKYNKAIETLSALEVIND